MSMAEARALIVEKGERLEYITLVWGSFEAVAALVAGVLARSVALMGFGLLADDASPDFSLQYL